MPAPIFVIQPDQLMGVALIASALALTMDRLLSKFGF